MFNDALSLYAISCIHVCMHIWMQCVVYVAVRPTSTWERWTTHQSADEECVASHSINNTCFGRTLFAWIPDVGHKHTKEEQMADLDILPFSIGMLIDIGWNNQVGPIYKRHHWASIRIEWTERWSQFMWQFLDWGRMFCVNSSNRAHEKCTKMVNQLCIHVFDSNAEAQLMCTWFQRPS